MWSALRREIIFFPYSDSNKTVEWMIGGIPGVLLSPSDGTQWMTFDGKWDVGMRFYDVTRVGLCMDREHSMAVGSKIEWILHHDALLLKSAALDVRITVLRLFASHCAIR